METFYVGNTGFGPVAFWFRVRQWSKWWVSFPDWEQSRYMVVDDFGDLV